MIFGSFLFDMGQCVSYGQETGCKKFPVRRGSTGFHLNRKLFAYNFLSGLITLVLHTDRKPFAYSFLSGLAPLRFISIGNYLRMVSYPA